MTSVGKILVFFNLLFSVAVCALIVMVFTTRQNWKTEYEKVRATALIAEAEYKSEKAKHESDVTSREAAIKLRDEKIKSLEKSVTNYEDEVVRLKKEITDEKAKTDAGTTNLQSSTTEISLLKTERDGLSKDKLALQRDLAAKQLEVNEFKKQAVDNKVESDTQRARGDRLFRRVEELERANLSLSNQVKILGASGGNATSSILNPPPIPAPKDVKGTVTGVTSSGIVAISLGSDSGINSGNKLEVYHFDAANPEKSNYLGEVTITRVEPKQSVGQFQPKPFARAEERLPKKGDTVSTGISVPGR